MRALPLLLMLLSVAWSAPVSAHPSADPALERIAEDLASGALDEAGALYLRAQRVFAPAELPLRYRPANDAPLLRCATPVVRDLVNALPSFEGPERDELERWLVAGSSVAKRAQTLSASGRFSFRYETTGTNAVDPTDVDPSNGVPDFVDRIAEYFDTSWTREVDELGFVAPDLQGVPYEVSFLAMGSYGYTTTADAGPAGTRIVVHNTFGIFPPNDDPEGDEIGAAKATAAHEFKHAIQYATSQWSETGSWPEVDATWVEDLVFDDVNDYYNYLDAGSPISAPSSSLDAGAGGSYEDCVWQHWMSERWDPALIVETWERRAAQPAESMLDSYEWALQQRGASIGSDFVDFASWNYATGARARSGFGYEEAADYPTAPLFATFDGLPASVEGATAHLAAAFLRFEGFSGEPGAVEVRVLRQTASPIRVRALITTRSGEFFVQDLTLVSTLDTQDLVVPLDQIEVVGLVVANGDSGGGARTWSVTVTERPSLPIPSLQLPVGQVHSALPTGAVATRIFSLRNTGESASSLDYRVQVLAALPPGAKQGKNIAGSMLSVADPTFSPDLTVDLLLSVTNASTDFEWLREVHLTLPAGVTVLSSSDFVGGSAGDLVSDGAAGDGVTVSWTDRNGSWGNVKHGETALATLSVNYDASLYGQLLFAYRIVGDGYGNDPHEVQDVLTLQGPESPLLDLLALEGGDWWAVGKRVTLEWKTGLSGTVEIDLSRDGGDTWERLGVADAQDERWEWIATGPPTSDGQFRLRSADGAVTDVSAEAVVLYETVAWLEVEPEHGSVASGEEIDLVLRFDASDLPPGARTALLRIVHNGTSGPQIVPVALAVTESTTPVGPPTSRPELKGNAPNPFNPSTRIRFSLSRTEPVQLLVYDARGRIVRELLNQPLEGGAYEIPWNSTDASGHRVASGTYLYVLRVGSERFVGRMTLVK